MGRGQRDEGVQLSSAVVKFVETHKCLLHPKYCHFSSRYCSLEPLYVILSMSTTNRLMVLSTLLLSSSTRQQHLWMLLWWLFILVRQTNTENPWELTEILLFVRRNAKSIIEGKPESYDCHEERFLGKLEADKRPIHVSDEERHSLAQRITSRSGIAGN